MKFDGNSLREKPPLVSPSGVTLTPQPTAPLSPQGDHYSRALNLSPVTLHRVSISPQADSSQLETSPQAFTAWHVVLTHSIKWSFPPWHGLLSPPQWPWSTTAPPSTPGVTIYSLTSCSTILFWLLCKNCFHYFAQFIGVHPTSILAFRVCFPMGMGFQVQSWRGRDSACVCWNWASRECVWGLCWKRMQLWVIQYGELMGLDWMQILKCWGKAWDTPIPCLKKEAPVHIP